MLKEERGAQVEGNGRERKKDALFACCSLVYFNFTEVVVSIFMERVARCVIHHFGLWSRPDCKRA